VLVHCMAGISRSSAVIIAYMMRRLSVSLENALAYVKAKRPKINPNEGFIHQLKVYEADLGLTNSKRSIDLEEMKENISGNAVKPKISRQNANISKEKQT
jgi:protein-tyrosine phosphatase